jgi:hypothetical protein
MNEQVDRPPLRPGAWVVAAVGAFGLAGSIALLNSSLVPVLDLGGWCASGGPFEIRAECPDTTWVTFVSTVTGLAFAALLAGGASRAGAPQVVMLGWPGLFWSLAWTMWSHGRNTDQVGATLPVVILFVVMGAPVAIGAAYYGVKRLVHGPDEPWTPPAPLVVAQPAPPLPVRPGVAAAPTRIVVPGATRGGDAS